MSTRVCPSCGASATLSFHSLRVTRGDRSVLVEAPHWECGACSDPETGEVPFRSVDLHQAREGEARVADAWEARYGERIPPAGRPGRKPEDPKEESILLRLSKRELVEIDSARGATSRSAFIRQAISERVGRRAP